VDIPLYYQEIFKSYTQNLLKQLTSTCKICNGVGYQVLENDMFRDCECIKKFHQLKKYTNCGINVKHIGREMKWFKDEFTEESYNKLKEIEANLNDVLKVNFLIYPANNNM